MLTIQEMLDQAVRGLRSQGWEPARDEDGACQYYVQIDGMCLRCAWGWVDPGGTLNAPSGTLNTLWTLGVGMAALCPWAAENIDSRLRSKRPTTNPVTTILSRACVIFAMPGIWSGQSNDMP